MSPCCAALGQQHTTVACIHQSTPHVQYRSCGTAPDKQAIRGPCIMQRAHLHCMLPPQPVPTTLPPAHTRQQPGRQGHVHVTITRCVCRHCGVQQEVSTAGQTTQLSKHPLVHPSSPLLKPSPLASLSHQPALHMTKLMWGSQSLCVMCCGWGHKHGWQVHRTQAQDTNKNGAGCHKGTTRPQTAMAQGVLPFPRQNNGSKSPPAHTVRCRC